jgi:ribulose-bisphosphate carboxylase large chain
MMEEVVVTYRVTCPAAQLSERVEALLLEQTVELPRTAVRDPFVKQEIVGRVERVEPIGEGTHRVVVSQPIATCAGSVAQWLNVLFGNSSLQPDIELEDASAPPSLGSVMGGPRFGIAGMRETVRAYGRPLSSTALKPMGLSAQQMAGLCTAFARAGIDVIKDDHGLADHRFCPFEDRVAACLEATRQAADETGSTSVYAPNLIGGPEEVLRQLRFCQDAGVRMVMVSPMLVGLPFFHEFTQRHARMPVLAHPAFGGALRTAPEWLLGRVFRWLGADAVIYPNVGGRFAYSRATCETIAERLRRDEPGMKPALPVPAGGIKFNRVAETLELYGIEVMLLMGGSLYEAGGELETRARAFAEHVRKFRLDPAD